ncbi:metabotropic glutamate receptor 6-like [Sycon ciliatum]|uniref:metabotropic glutamate receptor 6-like n=1 Tax=Sycon ciliatum TaxID=27933 RepID=UPI0031F6D763
MEGFNKPARILLFLLLLTDFDMLLPVAQQQPSSSVDLNNFLETAIYGVNAIVDIRRHCIVKNVVTPTDRGVRLGAMFNMHDTYSLSTDTCDGFSGWDAVQQSEAYFFMLALLESSQQQQQQQQQQQSSSASAMGSLPSITLGSLASDTCNSNLLAVNVAQAVAVEGLLFRNRTLQTFLALGQESVATECVTSAAEVLFGTLPLFSMIGPLTSSDTNAVTSLLTAYEIMHVSHWASGTLFDQVDNFPYLFRSVPSNEHQATAIADLVEEFGWRYVSLFAGNDDVYSGNGFELIHSESRRRGTFCLAMAQRFSVETTFGEDQLRDDIRLLKQEQRARVVILFASKQQARRFLELCQELNVTGKIFIGSDDWVNRLSFPTNSYMASIPILGLAPRTVASSAVHTAVAQLRRSFQDPNYLLAASNRNPWLKIYIEDQLECAIVVQSPQSDSVTQTCPVLQAKHAHRAPCSPADIARLHLPSSMVIAESVFLGLISLASVVDTLAEQLAVNMSSNSADVSYPSIDMIRQTMQQLELPCQGFTARCKVFGGSQSPMPAYYVQNVQTAQGGRPDVQSVGTWDASSGVQWHADQQVDLKEHGVFSMFARQSGAGSEPPLPKSVCSDACQPGQRRMFDEALRNVQCCWTCEDCNAGTFSNMSNAAVCKPCGLGFRSNSTHCVGLEVKPLSYSSVQYIVIAVFAAVGFVCTVLTLIYFNWYPRAVLVRACDLTLSNIALSAMLAGHVSAFFVITAGPITNAACIAHIVLPEPIKILVTASVLVKTNRINTIFKSMTVLSKGKLLTKLLVGTPTQIVFIGFLVLLDILLVCIYVTSIPEYVETHYELDRIVQICAVNNVWSGVLSAYLFTLLLACITLAFLTRNLPDNYNQSHLLYIASLTASVVWLGLAPAYFITGKQLRSFIAALFLEALLWAVWTCLYLPRLVLMIRQPHLRKPNEKQISRISLPAQTEEVPNLAITNSVTDTSNHCMYLSGIDVKKDTISQDSSQCDEKATFARTSPQGSTDALCTSGLK